MTNKIKTEENHTKKDTEINDNTSENNKKEDTKDQVEPKKTESLQEKYDICFNQFQRLQADFDNFRRRTDKEKTELSIRSKEQIILPLLEVIDNLERALKEDKKNNNHKALKDGVEITLKHLKNTLKKEGLDEITTKDEMFNPEKHEALLTTTSDKHEDDMIAEELQKGYMFKEKVIRPSKVKVVKNN